MIQEEVCPYCEAEIRVSCGNRPCPKCGQPLRITPDSAATLSDIVKSLLPSLLGVKL